jgi:drug/metabolite transporter (DMT)-like permease
VGLLAFLLLFARTTLRVGRRELLLLVAFGIVGVALVQWLYFVAIENLPVGVALLIEFTAPLFVALFARFVYKERIRRRIWAAVALCLVGLAVVVEVWAGVAFSTVGVTAALGGALGLTAYLLMAERERRHRDPVSLTFYGFLFATALWAVVQPLWEFPWDVLDDSVSLQGNLSEQTAPVWALVGFVVVVGTIITFSLLTGALRHIPATRASIVATLEPVIATGVAWVWLGESFGTAQLVGGAIVLAGIFLAQSAR